MFVYFLKENPQTFLQLSRSTETTETKTGASIELRLFGRTPVPLAGVEGRTPAASDRPCLTLVRGQLDEDNGAAYQDARRSEFIPICRDVIYFVAASEAMVIRAFIRLGLIMHCLTLRRGVAVLCAVAVLTIGFVHSVHHFGGPVSTIVVQAEVGSSDDSPDTSKTAPAAVEHCHGCSMIGMAVSMPAVAPMFLAADLPARRFDEKRQHIPIAENPPPISSI